ncbi:MAG: phage tail tape measure protein [Woeseia sp.]|nr:phage tail tape measure protein [Woeseia sp.]
MADLEDTIRIIFAGVDQTGSAIGSVASNLSSINDSVLKVAGPLADFATGLLAIEAAAFASGAAIAVLASDKADQFEISFREIATLIDEPVENLEGFRNAILEYGQSSTQSLSEIIAALYSSISAGVDYTKSLEVVAIAEELAIAGKADLGNTLVALVSTLNAYGKSTEEAGNISDIFFKTVALGQTTIPELSDSLSQVTSLAAQAGVPFDELAAAIAALTKGGAPTSAAITQVVGAISAIIKPSGEAAKLADDLGISFNAEALAANGLKGVLDEAAEATGGNVAQQAILFGRVQALNGVLALTGSAAQSFSDNLVEMDNVTGSTSEAAAKFRDVLDTGVDALDILLIKIGTPLRKAFFEARGSITDITNALAAAVVGDTGLKSLADLVVKLAQDFAATVKAIATNLPAALAAADFSDFEAGITAVVDAVGRLTGGFDVTSVDGLKNAIERLGSAFLGLSTFTAGAIDAITPLIAKIVELAESAPALDKDFISLAGNIGGLAIAANTVLPAVNTLLLGFIALGGAGGAIASVSSGLSTLGGVLAGAGAGFSAIAAAAGATAGALSLGVTSAAAAGAAIGKVGGEASGLTLALTDLIDRHTGLSESSRATAEAEDRFNDELIRTRQEVKEILSSLDGLNGKLDETEPKWQKQIDLLNEQNDTADKLTASFAKQGLIYDEVTGKLTPFNDGMKNLELVISDLEFKQKSLTEETRGYRAIIDEATGAVVGYEQVGGKLATSLDTTTDSAKEATEASDDFLVKMEEIASNERIKTIEAKVSLDIAQLEADTARVEAAFASINTSITSTGDVLNTSLGALTDLASSEFGGRFTEQFRILRDQIKLENNLREQSFELQRELNQAVIENLRAKSQALRRGDALIKVDGTNLAPELEAFMFKVLEAIQVKANSELQEFLLAVQPAA